MYVRKEDVLMERTITKTEKTAMAMPAMKRVAAYARVSSGKDEMLHSLAAQVSFYSDFIQRHPDWEYAGVYADEALTGTKDNRPEFRRLMVDCGNGKVDLVLTKSVSRFSRNTVDLLESVRGLKGLGVDVYFEEQNIHTMSGDGELMLSILASYAQEESRSVSENQKWRIRRDYREGKFYSHIRVFGYDCRSGKLTIIPEEAEVVRMIYADYLSGMGYNAIMKKLIRMGVLSKNGGRWSESCIASILKNEKYIGDMRLQKGYIADHLSKRWKRNNGELPQYYVESSHEPILDRETFEAAQEETARRTDNVSSPHMNTLSEFSGLIHCRRCGANFIRKINNSSTKYAKTLWACTTFTNHGKAFCGAKRIPEDILIEKCAKALGLTQYDADAVRAKVCEINVPDDDILVFVLTDGSEITVQWQNRSRRESWTQEMKEAARLKAKRGVAHD